MATVSSHVAHFQKSSPTNPRPRKSNAPAGFVEGMCCGCDCALYVPAGRRFEPVLCGTCQQAELASLKIWTAESIVRAIIDGLPPFEGMKRDERGELLRGLAGQAKSGPADRNEKSTVAMVAGASPDAQSRERIEDEHVQLVESYLDATDAQPYCPD